MATVTLRDVRKSYESNDVIQSVDLGVRDREFMVFVGPSVCGKSTLLRMITGLEEISGGELTIDGAVVNDVPPDARGLAMVFQSYALYPHMSVADNMAFALRLAGVSKTVRAAKVAAAAKVLQLDPLLDRKPGQLSGGQRQRVAIGRAFVRQPKVFLFDEPLSNLDASLRVQIRVETALLHCELKATMIYVTHDQVEAMTMADRIVVLIVVLRPGPIEQVGSPLELYHNPANTFVAGFISSPKMNLISAEVGSWDHDGADIVLPGGGIATVPARLHDATPGQACTIDVPPEALAIALEGPMGCRIAVVEHWGRDAPLRRLGRPPGRRRQGIRHGRGEGRRSGSPHDRLGQGPALRRGRSSGSGRSISGSNPAARFQT